MLDNDSTCNRNADECIYSCSVFTRFIRLSKHSLRHEPLEVEVHVNINKGVPANERHGATQGGEDGACIGR